MSRREGVVRQTSLGTQHSLSIAALVIWCITVLVLAATGMLTYLPTQLLPVPVVIGTLVPLIGYAFFPRFPPLH